MQIPLTQPFTQKSHFAQKSRPDKTVVLVAKGISLYIVSNLMKSNMSVKVRLAKYFVYPVPTRSNFLSILFSANKYCFLRFPLACNTVCETFQGFNHRRSVEAGKHLSNVQFKQFHRGVTVLLSEPPRQ